MGKNPVQCVEIYSKSQILILKKVTQKQMVNFNFGLGGLMGDKKDEDKTDDTVVAGNTGDDGNAQDDSSTPITTDDTATQIVAEKTTTEISEENFVESAEPVIEETTETEISNEPVFESETPQSTEPITETTQESGLQTMDSEEDWLKDESQLNTEPVSLDAETPEMPTFGEAPATESITELSAPAPEEATVEESNPFPEAATPEITEEVATEEVAEITPQETSLFAENTTTTEENTEVTTEESTTEPVATAPLIPAIPKMETPVAETSETSSVEETNAPEIPAKIEANTENASTAIPEIPTFEIPKKTETTTDSIAETPAETPSEIPAKAENETSTDDLFAPSETSATETLATDSFLDSTSSEDSVNNSSDDLFATTNTENSEESTFDNDFAEIDPLAPAATAVIGGSLIGDDDNDNQPDDLNEIKETETEEIPAKKQTIKPVETLLELKNGITEFVETHNSKIADYKSQISELNKKIREERHILKEEQKKSAKILADLNELVAGFSTTTSIKKKRIKKINNKKAA